MNVQCPLSSVQCAVFSIQCAVRSALGFSVQCTVCHKQMAVLGVMTEDKSPVVPQSANVSRFMLLPGSGLRKVLLGSCSDTKRAHP